MLVILPQRHNFVRTRRIFSKGARVLSKPMRIELLVVLAVTITSWLMSPACCESLLAIKMTSTSFKKKHTHFHYTYSIAVYFPPLPLFIFSVGAAPLQVKALHARKRRLKLWAIRGEKLTGRVCCPVLRLILKGAASIYKGLEKIKYNNKSIFGCKLHLLILQPRANTFFCPN